MTPPFAFTLAALATTAYALRWACNRARVAEARAEHYRVQLVDHYASQTVDLVTASRMGPDQIEDNLALRKVARERGFVLHRKAGA